uniref:Uncharacterized protein n=1 Tax=Anguilla anguilla TaxID=7936 RepID=A0A0E9RZ80_ANGAN
MVIGTTTKHRFDKVQYSFVQLFIAKNTVQFTQ